METIRREGDKKSATYKLLLAELADIPTEPLNRALDPAPSADPGENGVPARSQVEVPLNIVMVL